MIYGAQMPEPPFSLEDLLQAVLLNKKYAQVSNSLVKRIAVEEYPKHKNLKTATKKVRTRLHRLQEHFQSDCGTRNCLIITSLSRNLR